MANVGGVQYLSPQNVQPMSSGGGGGLGGALAGFQAGYDITKQVKGDIDAKKSMREFDRVIASIGDGEKPLTQQQFLKIAKFGGPQTANAIAGFSNMMRGWKAEDKAAVLKDARDGVDLMGNVMGMIRTLPQEQRMQAFTEQVAPLLEGGNPRMQEMVRPVIELVKDGNFSDVTVDAALGTLAGFGRFAEVTDNRIKAKAKKQAEDDDRQARLTKAALDNRSRETIAAMKLAKTGAGGTKPTTAIQEYEYAKREAEAGRGEDPGSLAEWKIANRAKGVTVQTGGPAKAPSGYRNVQNEDGSWALEAIPGGPAARKEADALAREEKAKLTSVARGKQLRSSLSYVRGLMDSAVIPTTGAFAIANVIPGTAGKDFSVAVDQLKANLTLETLQDLKKSSPRGSTGFGALSEKELHVIASDIANLDPYQTADGFKRQLGVVQNHIDRMFPVEDEGQAAEAPQLPGQNDLPTEPAQLAPEMGQPVAPEAGAVPGVPPEAAPGAVVPPEAVPAATEPSAAAPEPAYEPIPVENLSTMSPDDVQAHLETNPNMPEPERRRIDRLMEVKRRATGEAPPVTPEQEREAMLEVDDDTLAEVANIATGNLSSVPIGVRMEMADEIDRRNGKEPPPPRKSRFTVMTPTDLADVDTESLSDIDYEKWKAAATAAVRQADSGEETVSENRFAAMPPEEMAGVALGSLSDVEYEEFKAALTGLSPADYEKWKAAALAAEGGG